MKIQELLTDESKWTKSHEARDSYGQPVDECSKEAVQWCLLGAIIKCYNVDRIGICNKVRIRLDSFMLTSWNDAQNRTFNDIRSLIKELDI